MGMESKTEGDSSEEIRDRIRIMDERGNLDKRLDSRCGNWEVFDRTQWYDAIFTGDTVPSEMTRSTLDDINGWTEYESIPRSLDCVNPSRWTQYVSENKRSVVTGNYREDLKSRVSDFQTKLPDDQMLYCFLMLGEDMVALCSKRRRRAKWQVLDVGHFRARTVEVFHDADIVHDREFGKVVSEDDLGTINNCLRNLTPSLLLNAIAMRRYEIEFKGVSDDLVWIRNPSSELDIVLEFWLE